MQDHYQLTDESYDALIKSGVTVRDMFKSIILFDPYKTGATVNKIGLMYYVDEKGDFNQPPKIPHKKIAKAVFDQMKIIDKIAVAEYIDDWEHDFEDQEDEDEED